VEVTERDTLGAPATRVVNLVYDVHNRWIGETVDSDGDGDADHMTRFVYDGQQIVLQFESSSPLPRAESGTMGEGQGEGGENDNAALQLTHRYLWGQAVDQLLADEQIPATAQGEGGAIAEPGNVVWALSDQLGTVRDLAQLDTATGLTQVVNHRAYDSFGQLTSDTNAAVDCLFGFTGRALEESIGLQNNTNRWCDAKTGRWVSEDPSGLSGGVNLRRYLRNEPGFAIDPSGLIDFPTTKRVLAECGKLLSGLVQSGRLSQRDSDLRYNIVKYALTCPLSYGATDFDSQFFNGRRLKPTADAFSAYQQIWNTIRGELHSGCFDAGCTILTRAFLAYAQQADRAEKTSSYYRSVEAILKFPGLELFPLDADGPFYEVLYCSDGFPESDLMPGDWVWIDNEYWDKWEKEYHNVRKKFPGEEGSNFIYCGNDTFRSTVADALYDLQGAQEYVRGFAVVDRWVAEKDLLGDEQVLSDVVQLEEFKIKQVYRPRLSFLIYGET